MVEMQERLAAALNGRFVIDRELGSGGMATVYLARDLVNDRDVALKLLDPDLAVAVGAERFRREIEIARRLDHPHILPVWEAGEAAGSLFYTMPYLRGESLRVRLDREGQLPVDEAVRLACETAEALAHAHAQDVVHRDIKPENILLEDGHAVVADFGIARAVSDSDEAKLTKTGVAVGTPTYMSPEQAFGERQIDGRSDVYSLACVLYEMLAGQPPFTGASAQAVMARHSMEQVPQLSIVRSSVPEHIEDAIVRALAKTRADRFPSAADFAAALRAPGARGKRRSTRPGSVDRRQRRMRRAIYAALSLLPIAGVGYGVWSASGGADRADARTADEVARAKRVAVLYFDDLSADGALAPVADGLTEALIGELSRVGELTVTSRNGVARFRGGAVRLDSAAQALDVGTLVKGSVEPAAGGRVRITVGLRDAAGDRVEGAAASFELPATQLLAARDSVIDGVSRVLRQRLGQELELKRTRAGTRSLEAWTLVQRAARTRLQADSARVAGDTAGAARGLDAADALLAAAAARDPAWAEPVVGRGRLAYERAERTAVQLERVRWIEQGLAHAARALAMSPRSSEAHELRGSLRLLTVQRDLEPDGDAARRQLADAIADLKAATESDPSNAVAWQRLAMASYQQPDFTGAALAAQRAYKADAWLAEAPDVLDLLLSTAYDREKFADAGKWCAEGHRRFPRDRRFVECQLWMLSVPGARVDVAAAWRLVDTLRAVTPAADWELAGRQARLLVGGGIGRAGLRDSAWRVMERARASADVDPDRELMTVETAMRAILGDRAGALRLTREFLAANPAHREGLARSTSWWWRDLRRDPEWRALVGLPAGSS